MAISSDITHNPWVITGDTNTSVKISDEQVKVKWVYWFNPTTSGHLLSLTDKNGDQIIEAICEGANESVPPLPIFQTYTGVYCNDMDSGTLYIFVS